MLEHESFIRLTIFFAIFLFMAVWEVTASRRPLSTSTTKRWIANAGVAFLNTLVIRALFSTAACAKSGRKATRGCYNIQPMLSAVTHAGGRIGVSARVSAASVVLALLLIAFPASAYPPAVGILAKNRSCASCHASNGPWADESRTIIDVLDVKTKKSLRGADGAFRIEVPRGESRTVLTVVGRQEGDSTPPRRNAWLYVDPTQIETSALSKFAPGWDADLPMSCRLVGDKIEAYDGAHVTVLPMTVRPTDAARDAEIELQVMVTAGDAVKGEAKKGLISNYLVRKVILKVLER